MFNNPFLYQNMARPSLFSRLLGRSSIASAGRLNWGNILSNAQKSLGVINQAIPIVQQVKPMVNNAKAMFKIANVLKDSNQSKVSKIDDKLNIKTESAYNKPIFYI